MGRPAKIPIEEIKTLEEYKGRVRDIPLKKLKPLTVDTQWNIRARAAQKASKILDRFHKCALGQEEMSTVQLRAGEAFLKIAMPAVSYSEQDIRIDDTRQESRSGLEKRAQDLLIQLAQSNTEFQAKVLAALPDALREEALKLESNLKEPIEHE